MNKHELKLTDNELQIILLGLQKLPWETVNAVIQAVGAQIQQAQQSELKIKKDDSKGN